MKGSEGPAMSVMAMSEGGSSRQGEGTQPLYLHPASLGSASSVLPGMSAHQIPYMKPRPPPTCTRLTLHLFSPIVIRTSAYPNRSYDSITSDSYKEGLVPDPQATGQSSVTGAIIVRILLQWVVHASLPHRETLTPASRVGGLFFARPSDPSTGPPALLAEQYLEC